MSNTQIQNGGFVEKAIVFFVGIILSAIGTVAGYYCYQLASTTQYMEYQWLWVALTAALCFFMLRGAWHTVFFRPESKQKRFSIGGRDREF